MNACRKENSTLKLFDCIKQKTSKQPNTHYVLQYQGALSSKQSNIMHTNATEYMHKAKENSSCVATLREICLLTRVISHIQTQLNKCIKITHHYTFENSGKMKVENTNAKQYTLCCNSERDRCYQYYHINFNLSVV